VPPQVLSVEATPCSQGGSTCISLVSGRCPISHLGDEGRGLNRSAREAGIGKETGYRWLCEAYVVHRRSGKSIAETEAMIGSASAKSIAWEAEAAAGPGRHHLRIAVDTEARFWAVCEAGTGADATASAAGIGRSTGYRWLDRRFSELRAAGFTVKGARRLLRLTDQALIG
jgi:IS30 family transposase